MMRHLVWIWLQWWTHSVFRITACWNQPEGTMSDLGSQTPHFTGEKPRSASEPNTGLDPHVPILVYFPNATATSMKTLPFQPIAQQRSQGGRAVQVLQDFMWWWSQPPQQKRPWLVPREGVAWGNTADPQPGCSHTTQRRHPTVPGLRVWECSSASYQQSRATSRTPSAPVLLRAVCCLLHYCSLSSWGCLLPPWPPSPHMGLLPQPVRSLQNLKLCSNPAVAVYLTSSKSRSSYYVHRAPSHLFASRSYFPLHPLGSCHPGLLDLPHTCLEAIVFAIPFAWEALPHTQSLLAFSAALGFGSNITCSGCMCVCWGGGAFPENFKWEL